MSHIRESSIPVVQQVPWCWWRKQAASCRDFNKCVVYFSEESRSISLGSDIA
jgi:hypothetical protein